MAWTKKTNIKGPKGDDGIRGTKIFSGAAAPEDSDKQTRSMATSG